MDESEAEGRPKGGGEAVRGILSPVPWGCRGMERMREAHSLTRSKKADAFAPAFCGE